ncbi:hypothetical protein JR782_005083 [Salmonella enterica subsp. enterica serovar Eastbourne]|nr:hypothetical protein [Salmonella enterica subsp. enterica serovar Eastbourne]EHC5910528.1 hypothetical protein [Salmonella enterica subsp. enterica serovar Eastbourne]
MFIFLFPCGTQCSATYFYSHEKGLNGPFPLLADYDIQQRIALSVSTNPIQIYGLFQEKSDVLLGEIALDLPQGSAFDPSSIISARIEKNSILVEYINIKATMTSASYPIPKSRSKKGIRHHQQGN